MEELPTASEVCFEPVKPETEQQKADRVAVELEIQEFENTLPTDVRWKGFQYITQDGRLIEAQAVAEDGTIYSNMTPEERAAHNEGERAKMEQWALTHPFSKR